MIKLENDKEKKAKFKKKEKLMRFTVLDDSSKLESLFKSSTNDSIRYQNQYNLQHHPHVICYL